MARRLLVTLTLVAVLASAGCVLPGATERATTAAADEPAPGRADGSAPLNLYLLEGARPFTVTVSNGDEPSMLVDREGRWLWIADTSGLYVSEDGGLSWTRSPDPFLRGLFADGWAVAQDDAGTLYAADTQGQFIGVAASADGGKTWSVVSPVVEAGSIADRPWLAARGDGQVVLVQNGDRGESCAMSTDGGKTWLSRSLVNNGRPNAGNVVLDSAGRAWFHEGFRLWRWSNPCLNAPLPIDTPDAGPQIFTQVDVDAQDRLYFAQNSGDATRMILTGRSATGALRELVVSDPVLQGNSFGTLSVRSEDEIAVAWYGSETAGDITSPDFEGAWNVYVARVTGFWTDSPTVKVDRITTEANHVGGFCMGGVGCGLTTEGDRDLLDYFMVDYGPDGRLHIAYGHDGDTRSGVVRYAVLDAL